MCTSFGNIKRLMPVEPVIILYVTALLLQLPTYQHYLYYRARISLNSTDDENTNHCGGNVSAMTNKIQHLASQYVLAYSLAGTFPSMFLCLLYGPLSDRKGRKLTMTLPILGTIIDNAVTLFTIKFDLPVYVMIIGAGVSGLGGLFPTFVFTVTAYIADITKNTSKLPVRLATLEALALLGGVIAQATSGLWVKDHNYARPYWFMLSFNITAFLYIVFLLPESWTNETENKKSCCAACCGDIKSLVGVLITKRANNGRLHLILLLIITVLLLLPIGVITQLVILFSKDEPLCWRPDLIGYYLASLFFSRAIGAVFFMKLFKAPVFNLQGYTVVQIGSIFLSVLLVMIGLSTTTLRMFLTTIPALFIGLAQPCIKTLMSCIVKSSEQGSLFCITASLESLCNFLSNIVFNPLYQRSLNFSWYHGNGFVFFLNSAVPIMAFIIISYMKNTTKEKRYEIVANDDDDDRQEAESAVKA